MKNLFHYTACGLDYVFLLGGVRRGRSPYGETYAIEDIDTLNRTIALQITAAPFRLRGQEVRFLRAQLDLSQTELAQNLGTSRPSVARWESDASSPIPGTADRALRLYAAGQLGRGRQLRAVLAALGAIGDEGQWHLILARQAGAAGDTSGWTAKAA